MSSVGDRYNDQGRGVVASTSRTPAASVPSGSVTKKECGAAPIRTRTTSSASLLFSTRLSSRGPEGDARHYRRQPTGCPRKRVNSNPQLPTTPEEIAAAEKLAWEAGAAVVHVHLRDVAGQPTAELEIARRTVGLIRETCPALIQLSTEVGLNVPSEDRAKLVEVRPRMATLDVCSMSFGSSEFRNPPDGVRRLAARMHELSVKPELEVYDTGHLDVALSLRDEGLLEEPLQFSIVMGVKGGMAADPEQLLSFVRRLPPNSVWQVIAAGRRNLQMTVIGLGVWVAMPGPEWKTPS